MKITTTETTAAGRNYVPLPLGNGDLSLQLDFQGSMEQTEYSGMVPTGPAQPCRDRNG